MRTLGADDDLHPDVAGKADDQLLSDGYAACRARSAGTDPQELGINLYLYGMATSYLCTGIPARPGG